jgi:hypothetical protein
MDVEKILAHLRVELDLVEKLIAGLEDEARKSKRGRPLSRVTKIGQKGITKAFSAGRARRHVSGGDKRSFP